MANSDDRITQLSADRQEDHAKEPQAGKGSGLCVSANGMFD